MSFVDWCSEAFQPVEGDRFSSHAPFHFDQSIFDIYVSLKHGATLVLINNELGKEPGLLAPFIAERRISMWYSTPSILSFLAQYGKMERYDYSALRQVLFAGEVFPVKHLRALKALVPHPRYFNLYGPTETNVCTYYQVPAEIPAERSEPFPIGAPCSHYVGMIKVVGEDGNEVAHGDEGELVAAGPGVMLGYWNLPERTANAFLIDGKGDRWYRTGDVVVEEPDGNYRYVSRRDRMVKRRGYRIELGEIEAGLYRHPAIREVAVISIPNETSGVRIIAFLTCKEGARPSIVDLKRFCAENLLSYMSPDVFMIRDELPKTSTNKTDYQTLKKYAEPVPA
jgi:acyl-coenzyme A synthetase/AMP-(fatty) acid ligase